MKKYNVKNYVRYKEDVKACMPDEEFYSYYTRDELIIKFLPLVENLARKFATSQQASGVLTINDLIQIGSEGLIRAVDKLDWKLNESEDIEKTLKSFFSKRIKGLIRRRIDMQRGNMRIPEHKLSEIRKNNGKDQKMVAMFFNSMFLSIDDQPYNDEGEHPSYQVADTSEPYNIQLLNTYLLSIMEKYLSVKQYEVLRLSYGLDCEKLSAKEIANLLDISGVSNYVRVSEIKKAAIEKLIDKCLTIYRLAM